MVKRIALFIASLAAIGVLVVGLSGAGLAPAEPSAKAVAQIEGAANVAPTPRVQVDTIYLAPPVKPATVVVRKSVPAAGGEQESGSEGSGD
jgi:hypothetical protein